MKVNHNDVLPPNFLSYTYFYYSTDISFSNGLCANSKLMGSPRLELQVTCSSPSPSRDEFVRFSLKLHV
jgi:hypothetical protein